MNRTLFRIGLGVGAFVFLFVLLSISPAAEAQGDWWNDNWDYRRELTISGNNRPDDYQVRISFSDAGDLGGNMDNENHIRFTDNVGIGDATAGLLPFWIENKEGVDSGGNITAYVLLPDNADESYYMYYNNPNVCENENVDNAFDVFGYEAGFDCDNALGGWTETDPDARLNLSGSRCNFTALDTDHESYMWASESVETHWTLDFTLRLSAQGTYGPSIGMSNNSALKVGSSTNHSGYYLTDVGTLKAMGNEGTTYKFGAVSGGAVANNTTYYGRITRISNQIENVELWYNSDRPQGSPSINLASSTNALSTQAMGIIYAISSWNDAGSGNSTGWTDTVLFREFASSPPSVAFGIEEANAPAGTISITSVTVDNVLIDRDQDVALATPVLATQVTIKVSIAATGENANSFTDNINLFVNDNAGNLIIDNHHPIENSTPDNENSMTFRFLAYNPPDALADASCGGFQVYIEATDNTARYDNWGWSVLFTVDDLEAGNPLQQMQAGHRQRIYSAGAGSTASRVSTGAAASAITRAWIVDNNDGRLECHIAGANYDNEYYPTDNGDVYAEFENNVLDGISTTLTYAFPNLVPGLYNTPGNPRGISIDNALIDNHTNDNAVTSVLVEVVFQDNDGVADFLDNFYVAFRDAGNTTRENRAITIDDVRYENENFAIVTIIFDAENYNLPNAAMGVWDVWGYANDNWGSAGEWMDTVFTVDDINVPMTFTPTNPYAGWDLTVSGTSARRFGVTTIDAHRIVDSVEGTFLKGVADAYTENYDVLISAPGAVVPVTVTAWDDVLDGSRTVSYTVSVNQKIEIFIRYEENYEIVEWIPAVSRPVTLEFGGDGGTFSHVLTSNPENIIVGVIENFVENIKVDDNGEYWRRNVIDVYGGQVTMIIQGENYDTEVGGTAIGDMDLFTFFLQDFTGLYEPPHGIMSFRMWIGDNLAIINKDYWGGEWKQVVWLITGSRYQIWMESSEGPLRLIGPIDAVNSGEEKTIQVSPFVSEVLEIYDQVYWAAYRVNENIIRIEYQDNLAGTTSSYVSISDYQGNVLQEYVPDNSWFVITYSLADPDSGYIVDLLAVQTTYGILEVSVPIGIRANEGGGGIDDPFNLPAGVTLAALGSFILIMVIALAFDSTRLPMGVLGMVVMAIFCWQMGWLPLPGPFDGAFTATIFLVAAVLVILAWRGRK